MMLGGIIEMGQRVAKGNDALTLRDVEHKR